MGNAIPWILVAVAGLIILLAVLAIFVATRNKKKTKPDYYAFFWMGIIWMAFGAIVMLFGEPGLNGLFAMGLIFAIVGMANKDKWKTNRQTWKTLSREDKKIRMWIMIVLGVLVLLGLVAMLLANKVWF